MEFVENTTHLENLLKSWSIKNKKLWLEEMEMKQSVSDPCVFFNKETGSKSGRHVDDFLMTGTEEKLEEQIALMEKEMRLGGIVRLYKEGDRGVLLGIEVIKIKGGYRLQPTKQYIDSMLELLEMQTCKSISLPQSGHEEKQEDDEVQLSMRIGGSAL